MTQQNEITDKVDNSTPETAPPMSREMALILQLTQTIDQLNSRVAFLSRQLNERVDYMIDQVDAHQQILGQICEAIHLQPTITPRIVGAEVNLYTDDELPADTRASFYVTRHEPRHPIHGELEIMATDESNHSRFVTIDQIQPKVASALLTAVSQSNLIPGQGYHAVVGLLTKQPLRDDSVPVKGEGEGTLTAALETLRNQHAEPTATDEDEAEPIGDALPLASDVESDEPISEADRDE